MNIDRIFVGAGEWWNADIMDVEEEAVSTGGAPNVSNAFTINGQPGDLYPCSSNSKCTYISNLLF